ncbi:MAG: cellulase family glycosylhydrolase [Verrucomicrobia bacterium]|nr:cellulase family glycosylhydrolase [Verrucomicrobiota bacterium]
MQSSLFDGAAVIDLARKIGLLLAALPLLGSSRAATAPVTSPAMLHAAGGAVLDQTGQPVLLRSVNLSPWLVPEGYLMAQGSFAALATSPSEIRQRLVDVVGPEKAAAFWRDWTAAFVDANDFRNLRADGFNCVRLPLNARFITSRIEPGGVVFDAAGIAPVDQAVSWGAETGVYVILDLHDAPGGQGPFSTVSDVPSFDHTPRLWQGPTAAENRRKTIALWRALASRYAGARSVGGYDLLNEPALPPGVAPAELAALYNAVIEAIRSVDRDHMIVLEGDKYARDFSMIRSVADPNVMYEFHEYRMFNPQWRSPTVASLAQLLQLREATGKPVWLGEFGESSFAWQAQVVSLLKANGIGWAVWPWKRIDFGDALPVIEAIEPPEPWKRISGYLAGRRFSRKPSPAEAEQATSEMLVAIRTSNCRKNQALASTLAGH